MRKNKAQAKGKINISVTSAEYLADYKILLEFSNKEQRIVDFQPLFSKLSGDYAKYAELKKFRKFVVEEGNIYWGKNEDVVFPVSQLYNSEFSSVPDEKILYVI